jgi:hypothetical protein
VRAKIWIPALLLVIAVVMIAAAFYLFLPLPPPRVSLEFKEFTTQGTDLRAKISIANKGQTEIHWFGTDWEATFEIHRGWVTNKPHLTFSGMPDIIAPVTNRIFLIDVPTEFTRWQVVARYGYTKRHNARWDLVMWTDRQGMAQPFRKAVLWFLCLLPEPPKIEYGNISTAMLTNKPSVKLPAK